jgi:hypothetical protein
MFRRLITARALLAMTVVAGSLAAVASAAAHTAGTGTPIGTWKRVLTQADIDRTASFRVEPPGSNTPPTGPMKLAIAKDMFTLTDKTRFSIAQTLRLDEGGAFEILAYIAPDKGAFCTADEPQNASYTWKLDGGALVLTPVDDRCADRNSILAGRWTRASVTRAFLARAARWKETKTGATFTFKLSEGGRGAGSVAGVCKAVTAKASDCRAVLHLADGTIAVHGRATGRPRMELAVVSGTGAYDGATGSIVAMMRNEVISNLTLHLD